MAIDVVIPALDEADAIGWVVGRMPTGYRAIVVDNGSSDGTGELALAAGATVVHEPVPGFGSACHAGLCAATGEIVCFLDGDGSLDPAQLPLVVEPVVRGDAELVLGARQPDRGAMTVHQRAANRFLAFELRRRTGYGLTDLGPMRAARRDALLGLGMVDRRSGYPLEMVLLASRAGWRVQEVGVRYGARRGGRSKVTGTVKGTARAVRDMGRLLTQR